MMQSDQETHQ